MPSGADIEEYESFVEFRRTRGWQYAQKLFFSHKKFCLDNCHKHLSRGESREAGEWFARSKEPEAILKLISDREKELSDQIEKG
jgi:hypothetical protein